MPGTHNVAEEDNPFGDHKCRQHILYIQAEKPSRAAVQRLSRQPGQGMPCVVMF